ncbi:MAG: hypothetical protein KGQ59_04680, partial [Bdellovibrionales bacterium]|nr:hypothetical protein [Bdellovibrionales bacterium]
SRQKVRVAAIHSEESTMLFKNLAPALMLIASASALSACGQKMGPYPVEVQAKQKFALQTVTGRTLEFEADQKVSAMATYLGRKSLIRLQMGAEAVEFANAKFDKDTRQVYASPMRSGQGLGVTISRSLVCNPECEQSEVTRVMETCTYFIEDHYTVCNDTPYGMRCHDAWRQIPRTGTQWVDQILTTRTFAVEASLFDRSMNEVAKAQGRYQEAERRRQAVSPCY